MTKHEQKSESAEFPKAVRSRYSSAKEGYSITLRPPRSWEDQAKAMTRMVLDGVCEERGHDFTAAYLAEHLAEAEARGAAQAKKRVYDALNTYPIGIRIGVTRAIMVASDAIDKKEIRFGNLDKLDEDRVDELTREVEQLKAEQRRKDAQGALKEAACALERVKDGERGGYNARNGKRVSVQMSDGERGDIIHSEVTEDCERALVTVRAANREGGER